MLGQRPPAWRAPTTWSCHLAKTSGNWLIDGEAGDFAPGNGP